MEDINVISAFKRDMLTTDLVCFEIEYCREKKPVVIEINEEMADFDLLAERISQMKGFVPNWRELVIKPPFATQRTCVYKRM